jgi:osmotically-inducible protein OsmY
MSTSSLSVPYASLESSRARRSATSSRHSSPGEQIHDASQANRRLQQLHGKIVAALANSGYAALCFIGCDVDHSRVILRGCVPSYHLKQLAQVYAQRVDGVGRIDNQLKVRRREVRGRGPC